ncbi:hypothetical protein evm_002390 [Chilo suppressalis]|nr:hypothetical protein evm_002390 [Chilo suppressalis]
MDCKNNNRSNNIVPQPNSSDTQSYFTESNAGHITVQTTSPFRIRDSELTSEQNLKSKMDKSYIFGKKLPKTACSSTTSKLLVNQIIRETNIDGDGFVKEGHKENKLHGLHHIEKKSNYNHSFLINHIEINGSAPTFISENSSVQLGLCSREETIVPAKYPNSKHIYSSECSENESIRQKQYAEKATYCRPVLSFNNEFVNRTREKNIRLQRLVKKLVLAREREKETEALNKYINVLKTKHDVNNNEYQLDYSSKSHNNRKVDYLINNFQTVEGLSPCHDLLEEIYNASGIEQLNANPNCPLQCYHQSYLENTSECYPMSSQGRLMMLNKERRRNPFDEYWQYQSAKGRQFNGNTFVVDKELTQSKQICKKKSLHNFHKKILTENNKADCGTYCIDNSNNMEHYKHLGTQTSSLQEQYSKVSENVDRLKKKIQENAKCDGTNVLKSIENKLDRLITSLNSFMEGAKSKTSVRKCCNCHSVNLNQPQFKNQNMNISRSDTNGLIKAERLVCGPLAEDITRPTPYSIHNRKISEKSCTTNINKILIEEIDNSNKVKNEINSILNGIPVRPCPTQISLDIPTKERSTEVTDSFSKSKLSLQNRSVSVEEIPRDGAEEKNLKTLAVNTEPLGLFALLRVSTESVKQLLSYMPNFPYCSYLQMIPFSQATQHSQFVCNICGAAFDRPSQLTEHIQGHDLGRTRDCCVCRHVLDMQARWPTGLFRCQYCGQQFTRAYCCELHQESCAKRFGLKHDITPSLMLLR